MSQDPKRLTSFLAGVPYRDLGGPQGVTEDERIRLIAEHLRNNPGKKVGVLVELADPKKGSRYIEKVRAACPGVLVMNRTIVAPGANGTENISFVFPAESAAAPVDGSDKAL